MLAYAALSFLSAFLLFLVQPLMARAVLPWFGGAASVWTTSLLFYQALLFAGYAYGHWGRRVGARAQAVTHLVLVGVTLAFLPVTPSEAWRTADLHPSLRMLGLLGASVGAPYLLLAGTTPLLHDWFARLRPDRTPYRLYAASNAGSLAALLVYPMALDPLFGTRTQAVVWSVGFALFALALLRLAWPIARRGLPRAPATETPAAAPARGDVIRWLALAACGSGLLLALTNAITMDIAPIPLLWVLPLATYLVTFVLAFSGLYRRGTWGAFLVLALAAAALLWAGGFALPVRVQVALALGVLLAACMVCHGELATSAPAAGDLTLFYLAIAGGGALGGLVVAVLAPATLSDFYELPALALAAYALLLAGMRRDGEAEPGGWARIRWAGLVTVGLVAAAGFVVPTVRRNAGTVDAVRNFYGVLRVQDGPPGVLSEMRVLRHGRIFHGAAFLDPARRMQPTAYFTEGSGVALAIQQQAARHADEPMRVGVIGLGVGTIAAWGRPGDSIRFYELDPDAERLARAYFPFLDGSPAEVEVVHGDGRLSLERAVAEAGGEPLHDVLVIDAFSGDAVPVHLLTRESGRLYRSAVGPQGTIVFQVTNRHVDLERVVRGLALAQGLRAVRVDQTPAAGSGGVANSWMVLAPEGVRLPELRASPPPGPERIPVVWTDDFSSLLSVLR